LVVQHEDDCPLGWFGEWFESAGLPYAVLPAHRLDPPSAVPTELGYGYSGLVVLGGEMGAYDDETHPWLTATKQLIVSTVRAGRPFLGICLGHQLAAVALGGRVEPNPHGHATGLTPLGLTEAGQHDVLLGTAPAGARTVMWNKDVVTRLPDCAVELATSPDGTVQAARFAQHAWGVQFHPEASPGIFDGWTVEKPSAAVPRGIDVPAAARAVRAAAPELRHHAEPLAKAFARVVTAADATVAATPS
jgi:GMP synthase (glutamine-hydrolysing)